MPPLLCADVFCLPLSTQTVSDSSDFCRPTASHNFSMLTHSRHFLGWLCSETFESCVRMNKEAGCEPREEETRARWLSKAK